MTTNGILITAFALGQRARLLVVAHPRWVHGPHPHGYWRCRSCSIIPHRMRLERSGLCRQSRLASNFHSNCARVFFSPFFLTTRAPPSLSFMLGLVEIPAGAGRSAVSCSAD